ncbi:MAG TPA: cobyric acid synthase [Bryobacteraceae bacterium]|nr:cobyric acid synthase [Bryobacteraceae bacterium]
MLARSLPERIPPEVLGRDQQGSPELLAAPAGNGTVQMSARALMVLGTASHAGKSILTTALCRILSNEGFRVAPFKAQNMSLNSAATPDGREIGRAQALQAEACRIPPSAAMNPILIKPSCDRAAQIVVLGKVWGQMTAADYHECRVEELFPTVVEAYQQLAAEYDVVVLEGAGSPAEINLKAHDIVNMRMAKAAGAACLLAADIDRGGVFASLLGTVELLDAEERALLRGFIINKFRGDVSLLRPGVEMIAERVRIPCAGIVPWLPNLGLDEEDSVAMEERRTASRAWAERSNGPDRALRIGVIAFPYMANFTDFDELSAEPSVALAFLEHPSDVRDADLLILPGSKQTLDDLAWLRRRGWEPEIHNFAGRAGVLGICGGMQMMGHGIEDPEGVESHGSARSAHGLGLLPITTVLRHKKVTRPVQGRVAPSALFGARLEAPCFRGYEIHMGETVYTEGAQPFAEIQRAGVAGSILDGAIAGHVRAYGTYVHGLFHEDVFRHSFLAAARSACGLAPIESRAFVTAEREGRIDRLAEHVRQSLDMELIHECLGVRR